MKFKYTVPATADQGPTTLIGKATPMESAHDNALWDYNSMREHDGQPPLRSLPAGTRREPVVEEP